MEKAFHMIDKTSLKVSLCEGGWRKQDWNKSDWVSRIQLFSLKDFPQSSKLKGKVIVSKFDVFFTTWVDEQQVASTKKKSNSFKKHNFLAAGQSPRQL